MKKLLLVLMIVAMASFLLVGCLPTTPPPGDEEDGDEVVTEVTVDIADSVVIDGKTYVSAGTHDITVTFPEPVTGSVTAFIGLCGGDYSKGLLDELIAAGGLSAVMFPNEDRTIWTGSADFWGEGFLASNCCASYVFITSGECEDEVCIQLPVIVDSCYPYAEIEITVKGCPIVCDPEGCKITFATTKETDPCLPDVECCGDSCSGLDSWSVVLYAGDPFDVCCNPDICEEPIGTCSGNGCPIDCTTACLKEGTYYAIVTLVDNVGLETKYYAEIALTGDGSAEDPCAIVVTEGFEAPAPLCVDWIGATTGIIGTCYEICD